MSNVCSCPRYSGPSLFGAYMQSVRDRRPDAVVWCACIGWRDTERPAVATESPYGPVITALSPMHYPSDFHKPVGHSVTNSDPRHPEDRWERDDPRGLDHMPNYQREDHRPAGHSVTFSYAGAHGYPYRAECDCGWISKSYAAMHAARTMADEHIAEMAR